MMAASCCCARLLRILMVELHPHTATFRYAQLRASCGYSRATWRMLSMPRELKNAKRAIVTGQQSNGGGADTCWHRLQRLDQLLSVTGVRGFVPRRPRISVACNISSQLVPSGRAHRVLQAAIVVGGEEAARVRLRAGGAVGRSGGRGESCAASSRGDGGRGAEEAAGDPHESEAEARGGRRVDIVELVRVLVLVVQSVRATHEPKPRANAPPTLCWCCGVHIMVFGLKSRLPYNSLQNSLAGKRTYGFSFLDNRENFPRQPGPPCDSTVSRVVAAAAPLQFFCMACRCRRSTPADSRRSRRTARNPQPSRA